MGFNGLLTMKLRCKSGGGREAVRQREAPLACFEILYAEGGDVLGVEIELAGSVVRMAVEGGDNKFETLSESASA